MNYWGVVIVIVGIALIALLTYIGNELLDNAFAEGYERGWMACYRKNFEAVDNIMNSAGSSRQKEYMEYYTQKGIVQFDEKHFSEENDE